MKITLEGGMSTEKDIYHKLKHTFPLIDFTRIETMTKSGIPDLNYCTKEGIEGWIELKIGITRLKPSQVAWHTRAIAFHRRAFILTLHYDVFNLFRTKKFIPIDSRHFTPHEQPLVSSKELSNISICLTSTY